VEVGRRASGDVERIEGLQLEVDEEGNWDMGCPWEAVALRRELECTKRGDCERVRWIWDCDRGSSSWNSCFRGCIVWVLRITMLLC
jgi:hypothetical protein